MEAEFGGRLPGFGTPRGVRVGLVVFSLSLGGHSYGGVGGVPRDLDNRTRGSVFSSVERLGGLRGVAWPTAPPECGRDV